LNLLIQRVALLKKIARSLSEIGFLNTCLYALHHLLSGVHSSLGVERFYVVMQPVAQKPGIPGKRGKNIRVDRLNREDPALSTFVRVAEEIQERFDQGAVCFGAWRQDHLIAWIWLILGSYQDFNFHLRFVPTPAEKTCWDLDIFVEPEYRLGFAFARLWEEARAYLARHGVEWSASMISAFNTASLRSHKRLDSRIVGSVTILELGRLQCLISPLLRHGVYFSADRANSPAIRVPIPRSTAK